MNLFVPLYHGKQFIYGQYVRLVADHFLRLLVDCGRGVCVVVGFGVNLSAVQLCPLFWPFLRRSYLQDFLRKRGASKVKKQ